MQSVHSLRQELRILKKQRAVLRCWITANKPDVTLALRDLFEKERIIYQLKRVIRASEKAQHRDEWFEKQMRLFVWPGDILAVLKQQVRASSMSHKKKAEALLILGHAFDYIVRQGS